MSAPVLFSGVGNLREARFGVTLCMMLSTNFLARRSRNQTLFLPQIAQIDADKTDMVFNQTLLFHLRISA